MGEIADMMLEGTLCECCGECLIDPENEDDFVAPGFPMYCSEECARSRGASLDQVVK